MLILRIKQAEVALADGRLEEACELLRAPDLRSHRKGQELVSRLVAAFVKRGREHLSVGRCRQAFADAQKAFALGGNQPEVTELQAAAATALMRHQDSQQRKVDAVAAARQQLRDGQLTMAHNILAGANVNGQAADVHRDVATRRAGAETILARVAGALDHEEWDNAIGLVLEARRLHASNPQVAEWATKVTSSVMQAIRETIDQGRLDRADALIGRLTPLSGRMVDTQEVVRIVEKCRLAGQQIQAGRAREAEQMLRQLTTILPQAKWLQGAIEAASQAATGLEYLRAGPVGLVSSLKGAFPERYAADGQDESRQQVTVKMDERSMCEMTGLPQRFLLHVDGVGSYLVVRGRSVTIGPAAGGSPGPDVPLLAESGLAAVTIDRSEEDYFLRSKETVFVNERAATKKLLADGDQIALSARCRVKFCVPNAASTSAVLQISGTRLPRTDARRVILLDRELIIGPGTASHVRADMLTGPVVLYIRDSQLCCRTKDPIMAGQQPLESTAYLPMGISICTGGVSFVLTQA